MFFRGGFHFLFRLNAAVEQIFEDGRDNAFADGSFDETAAGRRDVDVVFREAERFEVCAVFDDGRVAEVVRHHDRRVQGFVVEDDDIFMKAFDRVKNGAAFEAVVVGAAFVEVFAAGFHGHDAVSFFVFADHDLFDHGRLAAADDFLENGIGDLRERDEFVEEFEVEEKFDRQFGIAPRVVDESEEFGAVVVPVFFHGRVRDVELFAVEEFFGDVFERVLLEAVIAADERERIGNDAAEDFDFRRHGEFPDVDQAVVAAEVERDPYTVFTESLDAVDDIGQIEFVDVVAGDDIRVEFIDDGEEFPEKRLFVVEP